MKLTLLLPIKTISERNQSGAWQKHFKRRAAQKQLSYVIAHNKIKELNIDIKSHILTKITCIRHASRALDDDNLASSFKHVIDGIASAFGINDRKVRMFFEQTTKNKEPYTEVRLQINKIEVIK